MATVRRQRLCECSTVSLVVHMPTPRSALCAVPSVSSLLARSVRLSHTVLARQSHSTDLSKASVRFENRTPDSAQSVHLHRERVFATSQWPAAEIAHAFRARTQMFCGRAMRLIYWVSVDPGDQRDCAANAANHAIHTKDRMALLQMETTLAVLGDRRRSPTLIPP
ncbi:hypothetical protein K227x_22510 [Rubripirellula lacrimiformis]|uniref:Uncharacterized protein n=1 Tax=Rubripirellula lacrimiformis TaxID=1930273 RepID=A0A517N9Q7_9BACT|nr:hypothetical protein K227x_22510 [Rubripirellula lacrimiformis]